MKKLRLIILIILLMTFNVFYSYVTRTVKIYSKNVESSNFALSSPMINNASITQSFRSKHENLSEISIRMATYGMINKGKLNIELRDVKSDKVVANTVMDMEKVVDNDFNVISFSPVKDSKNKVYKLTITAESDSDVQGVAIYKTAKGKYAETLTSNGVVEDNTSLVLKETSKKIFDIETIIILICFELYIYLFLRLLYRFLA